MSEGSSIDLSPHAELIDKKPMPIFVEVGEVLQQTGNVLEIPHAVGQGRIHLVGHDKSAAIIVEQHTGDQQINIIDVDREETVKAQRYRLTPEAPNCTTCSAPTPKEGVFTNTQGENKFACPHCGTPNVAKAQLDPEGLQAAIINDPNIEPLIADYQGTAAELNTRIANAAKEGAIKKIIGGDLIKKLPPEVKQALMGYTPDTALDIYHFKGFKMTEIQEIFRVQLGERLDYTKGRTASIRESDVEGYQDTAETDDELQLQKGLTIETQKLDDINLVTITNELDEAVNLVVIIDGDGDPSSLIVASSDLTHGWRVRATGDAFDRDSEYSDLLTIVEQAELLLDDGPWQAETESPFGTISVEYASPPNDVDQKVPHWAVELDKHGIPIKEGELYVRVAVPDYKLNNILVTKKKVSNKSE